ncbi:hypothetical protein Krac_5063 [Ktedonobacter racemifer DSM 44963]|uniref:Uncharacterized protein n=1 Tax=Ktedonobacter racemifer DSM 44963 TaxID=485913 RepID=D6TUI3_KTERA|nr:hypothetical protein Krac_5063 [Ktedonobacter racemifer DSM 44963]
MLSYLYVAGEIQCHPPANTEMVHLVYLNTTVYYLFQCFYSAYSMVLRSFMFLCMARYYKSTHPHIPYI